MKNPRSKGMRAEHEYELMEQAKGRLTYRVKGATKFNRNVDIFGLFDLLSIDGNTKRRYWIQVKSNKRPSKREVQELKEFKFKWLTQMGDYIVWATKIDYERKNNGWIEEII